MNSFKLKQLVTVSLLIALEVVLSRFLSISTPVVKFSLGFVPIVIIALLYGPLYSAAAWGISDFLGANLFPIGPYFLGFSVTVFLSGLVFGMFLYQKKITFLRVALASIIVCFVVQFSLDTYWLTLILGKGFFALSPIRFIKALVICPVMIAAILFISKTFSKSIYQRSLLYYQKTMIRQKSKRYLSGEFLSNRNNISKKICDNIISDERYIAAKTVFCYYPKKYEVDTTQIINDALKSGKTVCVPLCLGKNDMTAKKITSIDDLSLGRFGIMEPGAALETINIENCEIAVVPSLCCDRHKNRLGHGFGYYDKALKSKNIYKIAVCPFDVLFSKVPSNSFDIKMSRIVTESEII